MTINNFDSIKSRNEFVLSFLQGLPDSKYLLVLSGGETPSDLYKFLAEDNTYPFPEDVVLCDERWGLDPLHANSNALMIKSSGLLGRIQEEGSRWNPILTGQKNPDDETTRFVNVLESLFFEYGTNVVVISGMGMDCHTMGVLPGSAGVFAVNTAVNYASNDVFKVRITCTLKCARNYFNNVFLLLNGKGKISRFNDVSGLEPDISKYPVLIYNHVKKVNVLCTYL